MPEKTFSVRAASSDSFAGYRFAVEVEDGEPQRYLAPGSRRWVEFEQRLRDPGDRERFRCAFDGRIATLSLHLHGSTRPRFLYGKQVFEPGRGGTAVWVAEEDGTSPSPPSDEAEL